MIAWITGVGFASVIFFSALLNRPALSRPFRITESIAKVSIVLFFASIFLPAGYGAEIFGTTSTGQMIALQTSPNAGRNGVLIAVGYILAPLSWIVVYSGFRPPHRCGCIVAASAAWLSVVAAACFISQHGIVIDRFLHKDRLLALGSIAWIVAAGLMAIVWTVSIWRAPQNGLGREIELGAS